MKKTVAFIITIILLTGILVLCAKIPQSAIRENVQESAEYLCQGELFGMLAEGINSSIIDRYADSILLAIAYQYDSERPLQSVMESSYFFIEYQNENKNLLDAVTHGYGPNQQYLRYWHGSIAIVRPLLLFFNVQQIYVLNACVLAALVIGLMAVLLRNKAYVPCIGVAVGLVITAFWYVPFSLEYTWIYLLMLLLSIIGVRLAFRGMWERMGLFFLIGGMVTNYLDFLTTETLTLLVPLLLVLWVDVHGKEGSTFPQLFGKAGKAAAVWGCGYVGMWVSKWILASCVLQENVLPYVSGHIEERLGGDIGIGLRQYITGAIMNNVKCLFPLEYGVTGLLIGMGILLFVVYIGYVYHKKNICKEHIFIYMLVALIPYVRYIVLHNHSYLHYFFTYRAQMATIVAIVFILEELIEWRWLVHADAGRRS